MSWRRRPWRDVRFRGAGGEHLVGEAGEFGGAPRVSGRTLPGRRWRRVLRDRVSGWFEAGARRESRPGGNRMGPCRGWDGGTLPRAGLVGGLSCRGSLTVGEVSSGGAWPGSRIRYDEGGHSGRFRLGRSGLVQSRCDEDRGDGPFGDGRRDAGNLRLWLEREGAAIERWFSSGKRSRLFDKHQLLKMGKISLHSNLSTLAWLLTALARLKVDDYEHMRHMYIRLPRERIEIGRDPTEPELADIHDCPGCRLCPRHGRLAV